MFAEAGRALDVRGQSGEALLDDTPDVRVVASCIGLHLHPQLLAVVDHLEIGIAHAVFRLARRSTRDGLAKDRLGLRKAELDGGQEELLLRAEQPEEIRL